MIEEKQTLEGVVNIGYVHITPSNQFKEIIPNEDNQVIIADGTYDGLSSVDVKPIPQEYIVPQGELSITDNGNYNVRNYESAKVDVEVGTFPSGTFSTGDNGTYNVKDYEYVKVNVDKGIYPSGTLTISSNGLKNIKNYEKVQVNVPQGVFPAGTLNIKDNGEYDVTIYQKTKVQVDSIRPEGTIEITENGLVDIAQYEKADVNVPQGVFPTGTKNITTNGESDVTEYEKVNVSVPQGVFPSGSLNIDDNGTYSVTNYESAVVNVPKGITPTGNLPITQNGDYDVTNYASTSVNVPSVQPTGTLSITQNGNYDVSSYANASVIITSGGALPNGVRFGSLASTITDTSFLASLDLSALTTCDYMFYQDNALRKAGGFSVPSASSFENMFKNCSYMIEVEPIVFSETVTYELGGMFSGCTNLSKFPVLNLKNCKSLWDTFLNCNNLTTESLSNIIDSIITSENYTSTKTLKRIGLSSSQATTCTSFANWQILVDRGWTTGY